MALPIIAGIGSSIAGGFIAGLVQFFTTRAGTILAGLGLTFIGVKSFEALVGFIVTDFNVITTTIPSLVGGHGVGAMAVQVAAYVGVFDALNIVISGYMASASLLAAKVIIGRMK
ncbi:DUF2523 domain-containing protein [Rhodocyclus tenuis]|uniref:DUF2523 domain-containing protein n=1 Tax=Rhodocyclus gracilis TaxID=2929842 RepID=A0ABX0WKJ1_9RHOO|nr:DUF2523 family protein [Rhodocyclus gracilis]NJA90236.1 DUF2523 domain-containing protein [Rhodocyclus gracilis]